MQDSLNTWSNEDLRDYECVQPKLPLIEESITQLAAGLFSARVAIASAGDVVLYRAQPDLHSVGVSVLDPAYIALVIPMSWEGDYVINGRIADRSSIYLPTADEGAVYIRCARRDTVGIIVRRSRLIETLAALRGVHPDEVALQGPSLQLQPKDARSLRLRLAAMFDTYCGSDASTAARESPERFAEEVFGIVADAYLCARPGETVANTGVERLAPIVRRAERRFVEANAEPVSLADLCAAAGVGKSTLYRAFTQVCDAPPLEYFRRRRLTRARSLLIGADAPDRGGVKRAALDVGLTELGRFSVEYRRLFGESPSTTLHSRRT